MSPLLRRTLYTPPLARAEKVGGRTKLRPRDKDFFAQKPPGLFREAALVVCDLGLMPRKELYECWEVASRVHAHFPTAPAVADLAAGHGLLAWMLLLQGRSSGRRVVCVDKRMPASAEAVAAAFTARWPDLEGRALYVEGDLARVAPDEDTLLTALHACGPLTDAVLALSIRAGCAAAVVPCCHSLRKFDPPPELGLDADALKVAAAAVGAVDAIDACRAARLRAHGFEVSMAHVDPRITPYNKILLSTPSKQQRRAGGAVADRVAAPVAHSAAWAARSGQAPPPPIPIGNVQALEAMAGRREVETARSIEVSMWVDDAHAVSSRDLAELARRAAAVGEDEAWQPSAEAAAVFETSSPGDGTSSSGDRTEARAARRDDTTDLDGPSPTADANLDDLDADLDDRDGPILLRADEHAPAISAQLCDAYVDPRTGRSARSFRIVFSSSAAWRTPIERKHTAVWQRRLREALETRSAAHGVGFELR